MKSILGYRMSTDKPFSIRRWVADLPASSLGWLFLVSGLLFFAGGAYHTVTRPAPDRSPAPERHPVETTPL